LDDIIDLPLVAEVECTEYGSLEIIDHPFKVSLESLV